MLKNKDIICISTSDWEKPWGSKQHIMVNLAKHNRILYVEYQSSFLDFLKYPGYFFKKINKINKLCKINNNLYVYTPIPLFPFGYYFIFINRINQIILNIVLLKLIKKLKYKNPILWIYSPSSSYLIGKMNESAVIYHCVAGFASEKNNYQRKKIITKLEENIVSQAQIVLTLTKGLFEKFKKLNKNTYYFPSAVDIEHFEKIRNENTEEPEDMYSIGKPRLGVVGYLDGNILDIDLLDHMAKANEKWSLILVGPLFRNKRAIDRLRENKNIYILGEKPPNLIPLYIKYFDICLIPYIKNKFTRDVSPIKLYEYLAMGKPIVSTFFSDDLDDYKSVIGIAEDKNKFINLIDTFLHKDEKEKLIERIELAHTNSWQKRLDFLSEKLEIITA